jgi:small ligand-binding sensory domain FIST
MQEKARLMNQQHQASQQQAVSGLQGALASAEVAITASEADHASDTLAKQTNTMTPTSLILCPA